MPSKSMSPMQTKIGDASLKFGPDWLRALSSDGNGGSGANRWIAGSGGGGGGGGGNSGGPSGGYSQHHSDYSPRGGGGNQMEYHQHHQQHQYKDDGYYRMKEKSFESGGSSGKGNNTPTLNPNRFQPAEFKYSREEMLSLYDKNLTAPSYLPNNNGALFVEKMQPPLAFSQPSEDEIRIWHSAQPESSSSRGGGNNLGPSSSGPPGQMGGRGGGFAIRGGRGGGIERGRGRGRGYYNMSRPSHEEDDRTFNRPRTFERSQSAHERVWIERNGIPTGGPPPGGLTNTGHSPSESDARSGNWRSKGELPTSPYNDGSGPGVGRGRGGEMNVVGGMGRGRYGEDEEGWRRKQHWRREDEEDGGNRNRRLHKSWSEDGMHDNLPEWARDNPSEESGTFDSNGAFHDDRHSSTTKQYELKRELRESKSDTEPYGSQNDKVQKRTPERNENIKSVIPPSVKEEIEPIELIDKEKYSVKNSSLALSSSYSRSQSESSDELVRQQQQQQKKNKNNEQQSQQQRRHPSETDVSSQQQQQHIIQQHQQEKLEFKLGKLLQQQHQNMTSSDLISGHNVDLKSHQNFHKKQTPEEDHFMSLTEEAFVAKLIEEDGLSESRRISNLTNLESNLQNKQQQQIQHHNIQSQNSTNFLNSTNNNIKQQQQHNNSSNVGPNNTNLHTGGIQPNSNILQGIPLGKMNNQQQQQQQQQLASQKQAVPPITEPLGWLYLDPQGSVQGPFSSAEMAQWFLQGYFSGDLLLKRSCDKHFIPLDEMGKIYDRNPFINTDANPPPPILDPIPMIPTNNPQSALNNVPDISPAQFHQRQQQIRQQQQDLQQIPLGHGIIKDGWGAPDGNHQMQQQSSQQSQQQQQQQQQQQRISQTNLTSDQLLMLNFAKSQGLNLDNVPNTLEALQAYFQSRQMKEQNKNMSKADFINSLMSQLNQQQQQQPREIHNKATQDPIQNLVQQLTNISQQKQHLSQPQPPQQQQQQQQQQINNANKIVDHQWGTAPPPQGTPWGMQATPQPQPPQQQQQQGPNFQQHQHPWEYREQLLKYQTKIDEEMRRREGDLERKRLDDELERKRIEDQQKRHEEEQEQKRKILEEQFLMQQKQEELMKQQQQQAAEMARQKELAHQKLIQQQQILQQQQMEHQQSLEQQQRMAEELKKQQQQQAEQQRIQQEQLRQQQEQQQRQFTWQQHQQQQQQQQQQSNVIQQQNRNVQSLVEIQQEEARKQQEDDIIRQALKKKQMLLQQAEQQRQREMQQKSGLSLAWANQSAPAQSQGAPIKSLKEIQAEEQAKLAMQQEKERQNRAEQFQNQQQQQQWSSTLTWANRAKLNTSNKTNGGVFGEDPPLQQQTAPNKPVSKILSPVGGQVNPQFPNPNFQTSSSNKTNIKRTNQKEQEETLLKMFEAHSGGNTSGGNSSDSSKSSNKQQQNLPPPDEFTRWSCDTVEKFGSGSVDIPTFINFLKEVDSPFEVNDYVRSYLGDTRESREFAKEFVERRSRWKNKGTDDTGAFEDNLCLPASAVNPNQNDFQEVKAKGKKGKKQKMQKVDTRILGFNTSGDRTE